jgi:plasmid stability protein
VPQFIKLPDPVHAQLKALAAARGKTMVEVIADTLRQAVEAGEIGAETAGISAKLLLDLDAANEADQGPWVVVSSPAGDLPRMTREDA